MFSLVLCDRISAADEELVWNFSQTPAEHAFPVPNVSHSVALKVRVQSLPRQPNYPVLKCSIHSGLPLFAKRALDPSEGLAEALGPHLHPRLPGSPLFQRPLRSPLPQSPLGSRKCPPPPEAVPPSKAVKWLYSKLSSSPDTRPLECYSSTCANGTESPKAPQGRESPVRAFKSPSMADPLATPSPSPRPLTGETNPLIGSLLQERQEVIARIAQRLNFCDPTAPHLPDGLFSTSTPQGPKSVWSPAAEQEPLFKKTKEPPPPSPQPPSQQGGAEERSRPSPFDTPVSPRSHRRLDQEPQSPASKPASCRRLLLAEPAEGQTLSEAVQDISRLIQERLQQSQQLLQCTYKLCRQGALLKGSHDPSSNGYCAPPTPTPAPTPTLNGTREQDCSRKVPNEPRPKLEATPGRPRPPASDRLQNAKKEGRSPSPRRRESGHRAASDPAPARSQSPVLRDITQRTAGHRDSPLSPAFTDGPKMHLSHSLSLRDAQSPAYTDPHPHPLREATHRPLSWGATQLDARNATDRDGTLPKGTESPSVSGQNGPPRDENQDPSTSTVCTATSLTHSALSSDLSPSPSPQAHWILNGDARSPLVGPLSYSIPQAEYYSSTVALASLCYGNTTVCYYILLCFMFIICYGGLFRYSSLTALNVDLIP